jgi:DinB family protein
VPDILAAMSIPRDTIAALAKMPDELERVFRSIPAGYTRWRPACWAGVPGETFSALEHACHLRDIEIDGYQFRLRRTLEESSPSLGSIDGYALASERRYAEDDPSAVLAAFRSARKATLHQIERISEEQLARPATFEGHGEITLRGLVHVLCSHDLQHLACMQWLLARIGAAPR